MINMFVGKEEALSQLLGGVKFADLLSGQQRTTVKENFWVRRVQKSNMRKPRDLRGAPLDDISGQ